VLYHRIDRGSVVLTSCQYCQKPGLSAAALALHLKRHDAFGCQSQFSCPVEGCQNSFPTKKQQTIHTKTHK
jgi:hypothetical protein